MPLRSFGEKLGRLLPGNRGKDAVPTVGTLLASGKACSEDASHAGGPRVRTLPVLPGHLFWGCLKPPRSRGRGRRSLSPQETQSGSACHPSTHAKAPRLGGLRAGSWWPKALAGTPENKGTRTSLAAAGANP